MFHSIDRDGEYDELQHLYEITVIFDRGIPRNLLQKAHEESDNTRILQHLDGEGKVSNWPYQTRPKWWNHPALLGPNEPVWDTETDRVNYVNLITGMLQLDPEKRFSATQLLQELWLEGVV